MTTNTPTLIPLSQWFLNAGMEVSQRADAAPFDPEASTVTVSNGWLRGLANDLLLLAQMISNEPVTPAEVRHFTEAEGLYLHPDVDDDLLDTCIGDQGADVNARMAAVIAVLDEANSIAARIEGDREYSELR